MYSESNQHPGQLNAVTTPSFTETIQFYLLSIGLLIFFGSFVQHRHLLGGLFVSEILFIVAPSVSYAIQRRYNLSHTYSFFPISKKTALLAGIAAITAFVPIGMIATLQEMLLPRSPEYLEAWEHVLAEFQRVPLFVTVFIVAVLPGICEELLFRGFLLQGMRQKYSDRSAIIIVGVLFGVFHLDPYRFLPVTLLGILFGYMVVKTGSLIPAMVAHAVNNSISIVLSHGMPLNQQEEMLSEASAEELLTWQTLSSSFGMLAVAVLIFVLSVRALPRAVVQPEGGGNTSGAISEKPLDRNTESERSSSEEQSKGNEPDENDRA